MLLQRQERVWGGEGGQSRSNPPPHTQIISTSASSQFLLEELQALVVEAEARVAGEVQLLELRRKRLRESHLCQLVAAQVDTLRRR